MSSKNKRFATLAEIKDKDIETTEFEILKVGEYHDPRYGKFKITNDLLKKLKENFDTNVLDIDVAVDVNHEASKGAFAWIKQLSVRGDSLFMSIKEISQEGKKILKDKIFKYFSVEFAPFTKVVNGKKTTFENVLRGVALTNRPVIKGMRPTFLSEDINNLLSSDMSIFKLFADDLCDRSHISNRDVDLARAMFDELPEEEKEEAKEALEEVEAKVEGEEPEAEAEAEEKEEPAEEPAEEPKEAEATEEEAEEKPEEKPEEEAEEEPAEEEAEEEAKEPEAAEASEVMTKLAEANKELDGLKAREAERVLAERTTSLMFSDSNAIGFADGVKDEVQEFVKTLSDSQYESFKGLLDKVVNTDKFLSEAGHSELISTGSTEDKILALAEELLEEGKAADIATAQKMAAKKLNK